MSIMLAKLQVRVKISLPFNKNIIKLKLKIKRFLEIRSNYRLKGLYGAVLKRGSNPQTFARKPL